MKTRHYLWLAVAGLGFATGLAIPRLQRAPETPAVVQDAPTKAPRSGGGRGSVPAVSLPPAISPDKLPVSTDSMETLLALEGPELYTRLGLWLLDASEEQMAAYWDAYHKKGETNMWIKDLIFTQWAKKNPRSLIETAKRDGEEGPAWWAWSMSDPDAALAAVQGQGETMRNFLLRGLSNFHPEKALKMLEADPGLAKTFEMNELAEHVGRKDPRAGVEFLIKYGNEYSIGKMLKRWASKDPHEAFHWLSERGKDETMRKAFFDTVAQEHPEAFGELAAGLPAGAMKRELEASAFAHLVESDPEKALEQAKKIELPLLAAERLAQVGKGLVDEHPEQALETLAELLKKCPDAAYRMKWTHYPQGGGGGGDGVPQVREFLSQLAAWNPEQTMQAVLEAEKDGPADKSRMYGGYGLGSDQVANVWIAQDLQGYSAWWEARPDQSARDKGAGNAAGILLSQQNYSAAIEWSMKISNPNLQQNSLGNTVANWMQRDREAATQWLAAAELSEEQHKALEPYIPKQTEE
ncbi:hypothetical protein [Luteolibacter sp. Populi]|uniref:hypothetical protein n=1 Tax=Luteolibacter sp. Populi TaxID=3230487 RepID=UPI00346690AD